MSNEMHVRIGDRVITVSVATITPVEAKALLDLNTRNRPISQKRVAALVNDILDGEFKFNGDAIRLASVDGGYNNLLLDGQHRLEACIQSDTSITALIVGNLDPDVSDTIDQGKARSVPEILKLSYGRESGYAQGIAAMASVVWRGYGMLTNPTRAALSAFIDPSWDEFEHFARTANEIYNQESKVAVQGHLVAPMSPALLAALMMWMCRQGADYDTVVDFFSRIATGTISDSDTTNAVEALKRRQRNGVVLNRAGGGKSGGTVFGEMAIYVHTFNKWVMGEKVQQIFPFRRDIDSFADLPTPVRTRTV
jgi:hypothetical protein